MDLALKIMDFALKMMAPKSMRVGDGSAGGGGMAPPSPEIMALQVILHH